MNGRTSESLNAVRQIFLSSILGDDEFVKTYKLLKTDKERFLFALETIVENSFFLLDPKCEQKNSEHSIISRQSGNESFATGQYYEALQEYTESVVYAADSSEELALAYANRSAALFALEKHAECIHDIERVLNLKYPDRLKFKLYKRKGLCLTVLGSPDANSSFHEALNWLEKTTLKIAERDQIKSELNKFISAPNNVPKPPKNVIQYSVPEILSPNLELPCVSDAVELKYSKKFGRYLAATRKIEPGEVLANEKPYSVGVLTKNIYKYCSYCLQVSWTMIPCKHCVHVAYCSEACKAKAWDEYHEIECPVVGLLIGLDVDDMLWMSMRMAIMATEKGKKFDALKEEVMNVDHGTDPRTKGFCDDGKLHSDKYRSVYSLTRNVDKCSIIKLLVGTLWVALTTCVLARETKIFGQKLKLNYRTLVRNDKVLYLGELMLKQTYITFINMHCFGASRTLHTHEHGHALMVVCSLVNHSCDANTIRQWYADRLVLYAAYPIEKGEPIFDNYGPHYAIQTKSSRENGLEHWNFKCSCKPCIEDWPLLEASPSYKTQLLTRENKETIDKVLQELVRTHECLIEPGIKENAPILINELLKVIQVLFPLVQRPCKELGLVVSMLEDLYAIADAMYDYEPLIPSIAEGQYLLSYLYFHSSL